MVGAILLPSCSSGRCSPRRVGRSPRASAARTQLNGLTVGSHGSMSGHSRDRFAHWSNVSGNFDARETVHRVLVAVLHRDPL
ncbi:hypothetical protein WIS52_01930 [Pseudonocardia nematodicida]|uniref:Uncharacterized protein n=1 Tax=Pseudonocardia nematodicida TaxID=1206997 RepID=A0ABV1K518_9PSEU